MKEYSNDFGNGVGNRHIYRYRTRGFMVDESECKIVHDAEKVPSEFMPSQPNMLSPRDPRLEGIPRFLTIEQVAEELNTGASSIRALLKTGELRGIQVGGRGMWRIGRQDVEDYIEAAYRQTAARVAAGDLDEENT